MSDNNTTDTTNTDVSGNTNDNDVSKGSNPPTPQVEDKRLTQTEVDAIIKTRLAENSAKVKRDLEKQYEGKLVLTEDELNAKLKEYANAALEQHKKDAAIATKRSSYKEKGLTEAQLDAIEKQLDKPDDYDTVAETLFGALLKKTAPVYSAGTQNQEKSDNEDLNNKLREGLKRRKVYF